MRQLFTWITAGMLLFFFNPSFSQTNFWQKVEGKKAPTSFPMRVKPDKYQIYTLQMAKMKQKLSEAGNTYQTAVSISLPGADGQFHQFMAWKTPVMASSLAARYPEIRTFSASSTELPGVSAKLDFTDYGFHAAIYKGSRIFFIDPYDRHQDGFFIGFSKNSLPGLNRNFTCNINEYPNLIHPGGQPIHVPSGNHNVAERQNGSLRHDYKLALACTGEYAMAVTGGAPTRSTVLSIVVSTLNRINGVYEREFSITFTLIPNEDKILFTNPNTDPYQYNFTMELLLGENQDVIDSIIGHDNYDLGHIFCTAGGGLAALSSVCSVSRNAQGASTSRGADDFNTTCHELGHQFSCRHTFNSQAGGCNGNLDNTSSYEPGSGSTIMSYGGLCAPDNIVPHSDNYYSVASLIQESNFVPFLDSIQFTTCGTVTSGVNSVSIPNSAAKTYTIPKNTPFFIEGPQVMPSQPNASVSYNWEQYDLGNFGGTEADDGSATEGPAFRSYPPTDSSYLRTFPVEDILDGTYGSVGERLPLKARVLRFKYTVRSIIHGWGSFAVTDAGVKITVDNSGPFRVTAPSSDAVLSPGNAINVSWDVNGTDQNPVSCHFVNIYLSLDGGQSFPILLKSGAPNNGSTTVTIPNVATTKGYIKVQAASNIFYDVGAGKLRINGTGIADTHLKDALKVYPNPAASVINVKYQGDYVTPLTVNMYNIAGRLVWTGKMKNNLEIPINHLATGNYEVQVINNHSGTSATFKVAVQQ